MKRISAPWRMKFLEDHPEGCPFCRVQAMEDGPENLIVRRGRQAFVILNRYPYTGGHLLVVAKLHKPTLEDLPADTRAEMMELATHCMQVLRQIYQPHGFNLGANIGEAAGAGVAGHVHLHVVPRWTGDASFMLTLAETKVLPETLEETYRRVRQAWGE
ncbi:MAG: HIT domain-containing protein [Anaerolineales bacterium]|nr:HIT domain-containing protein [Anaerolineales bacterium]